jgi:hypothetical protein
MRKFISLFLPCNALDWGRRGQFSQVAIADKMRDNLINYEQIREFMSFRFFKKVLNMYFFYL